MFAQKNFKYYMKKLLAIITIFIFVTINLVAQENYNTEDHIICDSRIDSLVQLHIDHNKLYPGFSGYRIQLLMASGNDALTKAEELKETFTEKNPNIPVYITFGVPNYRVRVGDFRTRLEAENLLDKIDREYPGAWVTQDDINFPILPKYIKSESYE